MIVTKDALMWFAFIRDKLIKEIVKQIKKK